MHESYRNLAAKAPLALAGFEVLANADNLRMIDPPTELVQHVAEFIVANDAPVVAGAMAAQVDFLATYDQKHLLRQGSMIHERFGVVVAAPADIISAI